MVGETTNYIKRISKHKSCLRGNKHENKYLQNAWNKYGEDSFSFEILEEWPVEYLKTMENWWCKMLDSHNPERGYNIKPTNNNGKIFCSREVIELLRIKNTGKKRSEQFCKKLAENKIGNQNWTGKKHKESSKEQCRIANIGQKRTEETKANISKAKKGKPTKAGILKQRKLLQYTIDNIFIKEHVSIVQAAASINSKPSSLYTCMSKKEYKCKGYIWKYKD